MMGPCIFSGYYKRPEKTAEAFDKDGWFLTGDIVTVYPNGSIKIIDRAKNIFKLSQGEYIAPEKVEGVLSLNKFIAMSFVYGDSFKDCTVCVLVIDPEVTAEWAKTNNIQKELEDVITDGEFLEAFQAEVERVSKVKNLSKLEIPKQFHFLL